MFAAHSTGNLDFFDDMTEYTVEGTCGCATNVTCTWTHELFTFEVVSDSALDSIPGHGHGTAPVVDCAALAFAGADIRFIRHSPHGDRNITTYRTGASING